MVTMCRLGFRNLVRVFVYKSLCRMGAGPLAIKAARLPDGAFFNETRVASTLTAVGAPPAWRLFGWKEWPNGECPDWFLNAFNQTHYLDSDKPWWQLSDFSNATGDIKCIWEWSRWDWVLLLAQRAAYSGDTDSIRQINRWLNDWVSKNPAYFGPNWKCGQEASIRLIHIAFAAFVLDDFRQPQPALRALVRQHLQRIAPTVIYAIAQDNNHGTSEAAALFVAGSWLSILAPDDSEAERWMKQGRALLNERAERLILLDGTFSQYSSNYHRLMLDTLSMAEWWRRLLNQAPFSEGFYRQAIAASRWLHALVDPENGDAPNLGANDGALLLPVTSLDYRDYRPSVQLASALFLNCRAYSEPSVDQLCRWLGVSVPEKLLSTSTSQDFCDGGLVLLRNQDARAYLRYPRFRFRPSHADCMHVDLWVNGVNLLRDGGTYSYNTSPNHQRYFPGTESHNTVEFDGRDQMPRLSRFLFGAWPSAVIESPLEVIDGVSTWAGSYCDWLGARHSRSLTLRQRQLTVVDHVSGFERCAVLRWRLLPGGWRLEGNTVKNDQFAVKIEAEDDELLIRLSSGFESRYYHQVTALPVIEVVTTKPGQIHSIITW